MLGWILFFTLLLISIVVVDAVVLFAALMTVAAFPLIAMAHSDPREVEGDEREHPWKWRWYGFCGWIWDGLFGCSGQQNKIITGTTVLPDLSSWTVECTRSEFCEDMRNGSNCVCCAREKYGKPVPCSYAKEISEAGS